MGSVAIERLTVFRHQIAGSRPSMKMTPTASLGTLGDEALGVLDHAADIAMQTAHVYRLLGCQNLKFLSRESAVSRDFTHHFLRRRAGKLANCRRDDGTERQNIFIDGDKIRLMQRLPSRGAVKL